MVITEQKPTVNTREENESISLWKIINSKRQTAREEGWNTELQNK